MIAVDLLFGERNWTNGTKSPLRVCFYVIYISKWLLWQILGNLLSYFQVKITLEVFYKRTVPKNKQFL